jgi:hypothetical protein
MAGGLGRGEDGPPAERTVMNPSALFGGSSIGWRSRFDRRGAAVVVTVPDSLVQDRI